MDIAGEVGIGAAQGYGELMWDTTKDLVLLWATGGVYTGIKFWGAVYAGYQQGGVIGALPGMPLRPCPGRSSVITRWLRLIAGT